jgi:uncharacterized BrkB/YihY/UPF0761 family membrane protein
MVAIHPFVFTLLGLVAAADVGVLGYLFNQHDAQGWFSGRDGSSSSRVRSIMIFALFTASWTTLFAFAAVVFVFSGSLSFFAGIASSLLWLIITIVFWAVSTSLFHNVRDGGACDGQPIISMCRQLQTVEGLGWTALGLSVIAMVAGCFAYNSHRRTRNGSHRV